MRQLTILTVFFLSGLLSASTAASKDTPTGGVAVAARDPVFISMVGSNAIENELPFGIFNGKGFKANPKAKFVKLHIFPDQPIKGLVKMEIESCKDDFVSAFAYLNFDEKISKMDEEEPLIFDTPAKFMKVLTLKPYVDDFNEPVESITINLMTSSNVCVKELRLLEKEGRVIAVKVPSVRKGTAAASSILSPVEAYSPQNLFDSRFESAWATNKQMTGSTLEFSFPDATQITKLKIWNGYQRSVIHCQDNSRIKKLEVTGDNGYKTEVMVQDVPGSQTVDLPKPFSGKRLTLKVAEAFKGRVYADLVASELRFFDGKEWFLVDPLPQIQELNKKMTDQFTKAGLAAILNNQAASQRPYWAFRIRSDGTIFINGSTTKNDTGLSYSALGNYEIKSVTDKSIELRVFGFLKKSKFSLDCNGCGLACNAPAKQKDVGARIFQENVTLTAVKNEDGTLKTIAVVNNGKKKLPFTKVNLTVSEEK